MESPRSQIESITRGQWQWNSNQDPLLKCEELRWESYNPKENYLLEKAYCEQQREVDLGDSIVFIKNMNQIQKTTPPSQRPVRRINFTENLEEVNRKQRYSETELPKTINKIFGSLGDFIRFFSKRNPEILHFTQKFEEFESSDDVNSLNNEILPTLLECLSQELTTDENAQELLRLFKKVFTSFKEFYGQILKAYTMNSCLYKNLNKYLRNESWMEIDSLLPYAFCLCKTFLTSRNKGNNTSTITLYRGTALDETTLSFYDLKKLSYFSWNSATSTSKSKRVAQNFMFGSADILNKKYPVMFIIEVPIEKNLQSDQRWIEAFPYSAFPKEDEILLAPGSSFELQDVEINHNKIAKISIKMKNETKSLAYRGFMMQGALQTQMLTDPILRIMCLEGEELGEALGHVFGNKFIEKIEFYFCEFNQSLLRKMMQVLSTTENVHELSFVSCSNQDDGKMSSLNSTGIENFNITKLEIFEKESLNMMFTTGSTHSDYWVSLKELNLTFQAILDETINHLCWQGLSLLTQLTNLSLDFNRCYLFSKEGVYNLCSNGLKYLTQLIYLHLDFTECGIREEGINTLCSQGLHYLTRLTSLSLKIDIFHTKKRLMTDKEIESLCLNALRYLTELTSLEIEFPCCTELTNQGMYQFSSQGLQHLSQLVSLRISFPGFEKLNDEGIVSLFDYGIKWLKNLIFLDLDFYYCPQLTDQGVKNLSCQVLKYLTHLKSINLQFSSCFQLTDQAFNHLFKYGLMYLPQLEVLKLNFKGIKETTTGEELMVLILQFEMLTLNQLKFFSINNIIGLDTMNQSNQRPETPPPSKFICNRILEAQSGPSGDNKNLSSLFLKICQKKFQKLPQISKQSWSTSKMSPKAKAMFKKLKRLSSCDKQILQGLKILPQSELLKIYVSQFESKSDEELRSLCSQKPRQLARLESLTLDFARCSPKTNNTLKVICSQGLHGLIRLASLKLDFSQDTWYTDQRIKILCFLNLRPLVHLKSLDLNFSNPCKITDEGIKNLCIQGLQHLSQLEHLSLDFTKGALPFEITDQGVKDLCIYGLRYLTRLTFLDLNFTECDRIIKDDGLNTVLDYGIENLTQLKYLNLDFTFSNVFNHMPNSINCRGFRKLTQLTSFSLSFSQRYLMTEKGMENLCLHGLQNLPQLVSLNINFSECRAIRDQEVNILCSKGLKYLSKLEYLTLDFTSCAITDQGVNKLCFEIPKYLAKLISLELCFEKCSYVTSPTKLNILRVLRFFGFSVLPNV